jgi:hypothetical protein
VSSAPSVPSREVRRRQRRVAAARRWTVRVVAAAVLFGLGVALGEALHDNPVPGPLSTSLRTVRPVAPVTVTVTVSQ